MEDEIEERIISPFSSLSLGRDEPSLSDTAGHFTATEWYEYANPGESTFKLAIANPKEIDTKLEGFNFEVPDLTAPEDVLQPQFVKLLQEICRRANSGLTVVGANRKPTLRARQTAKRCLKPDVVFLTSPTDPLDAANFVTIAEFKIGTNLFTDDNRTQVFTYCQRLIMIEQPDRSVVHSFLLNTRNIQFIRVERLPSGKFLYEYTAHKSLMRDPTNPEVLPMGLVWLYKFLKSSPEALGRQLINSPFHSYILSSQLGRGFSSKVYALQGRKHKNKVVKIYNTPESDEEAAILRLINDWDLPYVPKLIESDEETKMALVLSPKAEDFSLFNRRFNLRHAQQTLTTLRQLHEKKYVHRDIRPGNLLLHGKDVLVNDWGYAVPADNAKRPYRGAFFHASDRILDLISKGEKETDFLPADDLVSLVRAVWTFTNPQIHQRFERILGKHNQQYTKDAALETIKLWKEALPGAWIQLQQAAQLGDSAALEEGFNNLVSPI